MITKKLRNRILKEMVLTEKEKVIKELVEMGIWSEKKIRLRWGILEKELRTKEVHKR